MREVWIPFKHLMSSSSAAMAGGEEQRRRRMMMIDEGRRFGMIFSMDEEVLRGLLGLVCANGVAERQDALNGRLKRV